MDRVRQIHTALIEAFTPEELNELLAYSFDTRLDRLSEKGTKGEMFLNVVDAAIAGGWMLDLANEAFRAKSGNNRLHDFYTDHVRPTLKGENRQRTAHPLADRELKESADVNARIRELEILLRGLDGYNGLLSKMRIMQWRLNLVIGVLAIQSVVMFSAIFYFAIVIMPVINNGS